VIVRPPGGGGEDRQATRRYAMGLVQKTGPVVAIMNGEDKYALNVAVTQESVTKFIKDYLAGTLAPSVASEEESEGDALNVVLKQTIPSITKLTAVGLREAVKV